MFKNLLAAMAMLVSSLGFAQAPTEMVAQLIEGYDIVSYDGFFSHDRMVDGVKSHQVHGDFRLNANQEITYLEIDGIVVHDDAKNPKSYFPSNSLGEVVDFYMYVFAHTASENDVLFGNVRHDFLEAGEDLLVELQPDSQRTLVSYDVPTGVNPDDVRLNTDSGYVGAPYDEGRGGFSVWHDPMDGVINYEIYLASTGEVLSSGTISPVDESSENEGHQLNIGYVDGIRRVNLHENFWQVMPSQTFTGMSELDGQLVPSKVFILDRPETRQATMVMTGFVGTVSAKIHRVSGEMADWPLDIPQFDTEFEVETDSDEVEVVTIEELMAQIEDLMSELPDLSGTEEKAAPGYPSNSTTSLVIPEGPSKLVIIFYGNEDPDGEFSVSFYNGGPGLG